MDAVIGLLAGVAALLGAAAMVRRMEKRIRSREKAYSEVFQSSKAPAASRGEAGAREVVEPSGTSRVETIAEAPSSGRVIGVTMFTWDAQGRRITGTARHGGAASSVDEASVSYVEAQT